jgi:hypothetical protein
MQNTTTCLSPDTAGKKPRQATTTVKFPTYGCKLVITVVDNVKYSVEKLYKKYKIKEDFDFEAEGALVMPGTETYYLLLDKAYLTHNTIAHEIFHAAVRITEDRGITDEEAQAWMAGHITETLYKFLEKKKLQVKHG